MQCYVDQDILLHTHSAVMWETNLGEKIRLLALWLYSQCLIFSKFGITTLAI